MMRPACAYPPVIQTGPDLYGDREGLGFGFVGNQGPAIQTIHSNPTVYPSSMTNGIVGNSPLPTQHPSFTLSAYPQLPLQQQQQSYTSVPSDLMASSHINPTFQAQQPYQTVSNPNSEKLVSHNRSVGLYSRSSNVPSQPAQPQQPTATLTSYGVVTGPGSNSVMQGPPLQQRMSVSAIGPSPVNRTMLQPHMPTRSGNLRPVAPMSDPNGFQSPSLYVSYPSGGSNSQPCGNLPVPYSIAISNTTIPVAISSIVNNSSLPLGVNYGPSLGSQNSTGSGRPSGPGVIPSSICGMQSSMYASQTRLPNASSNYPMNTYVGPQQYVSCSSVPFRAGNGAPVGMQQQGGGPILSRPTTASSPQLNKVSTNPSCLGVHPVLTQQQSSQMPSCVVPSVAIPTSPNSGNSAPPSMGPNCKSHTASGFRPCSTTAAGVVYNQLNSTTSICTVPNMSNPGYNFTPNTAITPPNGGLLIGGPPHALGSSLMGPMNGGCLSMNSDGDVKMNSAIPPDGCYIQNRPMSSGGRDSSMPSGDLLISSPFQMSAGLNASTAMSYAPNQQMSVLPGEFDPMTPSNASPLMMMAMPASSPIPGSGLINGAISAGVMNIAMGNSSTPAPPPYHQTNCRSIGPSSFFGPNAMSMPPVTVTTTVHMNASPTILSLSEGPGVVGMSNEQRHMLGLSSDPVAAVTAVPSSVVGKQAAGGGGTTSKSRPKRVRANKNSGRASKANSKKNANASANTVLAPTPDMFVSNPRLLSQPMVRQKVPSWGMSGVCPSSVGSFPSGIISPTLSMPLSGSGGDSRGGCISPASFTSSNSALMRPNSGPPIDPAFTTMSHCGGPGNAQVMLPGSTFLDSASRLSSSPRQTYLSVQSLPQQQQQYFPSTVQSNSLYFNSHVGGSSGMLNPMMNMTPVNNSTLAQQPYHGANQSQSLRCQPSAMHFQPHPVQQPISSNLPLAQRPSSQTPAANVNANSVSYSGPGTNASYGTEMAAVARHSIAPHSSSVSSTMETPFANCTGDTDRLVCPITNGMVWGPTQIQLNEVMNQYLVDGVYVRRFEFDLTANHLNTIVGRSDLDIVVCSHLLSEPLQVCHWPSDAVQIRFNDYLLRLDRSSVNGGQSAHKVACVKQLCHPGRNYLEIAIVALGEDPNQPSVMAKRRTIAAALEMHRFAAFMAHMPALNVLLDGLQRRRPAGVSTLCDILEGRVDSRAKPSIDSDLSADVNQSSRTTPVVAELSLICPVFRTRMRVPGRITGCEHVEAFDMEAFLRREVLWPRLSCPICGHKSPAGLDGLCIDTTILNALSLIHPAIDSILIRSDGYWRLPPPICLDLPPDIDQWQPLIGPLTEVVTRAFNLMAMVRVGPKSLSAQPSSHSTGNSYQTTEWNTSCGAQQQQHKTIHINRSKSYQGPTGPTDVCNGSGISSAATPTKELIASPPWTSSSESPSHHGLSYKPLSAGTEMGRNVTTMPIPQACSISRPSSQPLAWTSVQCSPVDRSAVTPQYVRSPSLVGEPHHQYPFSDPAGTNPSVVPHMSKSSDAFSGQNRAVFSDYRMPSRLPNSADPHMGKIRHPSTGSTRCLDNVPTDRSQLPSSLERVGHVTSMGSLEPVLSSSNSPIRSLPNTHPHSLPASPAPGARPSSTSNFSIPAIPGVNMNVVEQAISAPLHPCPSSLPVTSVATTPGSQVPTPCAHTESSSQCCPHLSDMSGLESDGGSPSPNLAPITAAASAFMLTDHDARKSNGYLPSESEPVQVNHPGVDATRRIDNHPSTEKKPASSLNMGLDFLLAEDQALAAEGKGSHASHGSSHSLSSQQNPNVSTGDLNCQISDHRNLKRSYGTNSEPSTCVTHPSSVAGHANAHFISSHCPTENDKKKLPTYASENISFASRCAATNPQNVNPEHALTPKNDPTPFHSTSNPDISTKRMKLESNTIANIKPVVLSNSDGEKPTQLLKQSPPLNDHLDDGEKLPFNIPTSGCFNSTDKADHTMCAKKFDNTPLVNYTDMKREPFADKRIVSDLTSLPPIPTELDEERVCGEVVRSISSQIDRLDVFLEESYVRFVESFPCI